MRLEGGDDSGGGHGVKAKRQDRQGPQNIS